MTELATIREAIDHAAELVATLPAEQWGQWVAYMLKQLDRTAQERGERELYLASLYVVGREIAAQLDLGRR